MGAPDRHSVRVECGDAVQWEWDRGTASHRQVGLMLFII